MKFLFDFFPIILFFAAFKFYGIYVATAVAIVASMLQVLSFWFKHRRLEIMHLLTLLFIVLLGGATLAFHNEIFIKWKPTVLDWIFASVFLITQFLGDKTLTQRMLEKNITLPAWMWIKLNLSWVGFFLVMGCANLYVAYRFDTNTWVNFKLFGILGGTALFVIAQSLYMARYIEVEKKEVSHDDTSSH